MDTIHAADKVRPTEPDAGSSGPAGVLADEDVRSTLVVLSRREKALTKLLETPATGASGHRNAVHALVIAYEPRLAGIAMCSQGGDLKVDTAWCDGEFIEAFTWTPDPGILCDMAGAADGCWSARLEPTQLPGTHLLADLGRGDFYCEVLRSGSDIAGYLFRVEAAEADVAATKPNDLGHLIATKLSAELEHEAERRARRTSEQQFEDVATTSFDWFWTMDTEYRFTYISDRWREITGLDPAEFIGKSLVDLGADLGVKRWRHFFAALDARQAVTGLKSRTIGSDGKDCYWTINAKPWFDVDGSFKGYRGTGTDITAEVRERGRAERAERLLRDAIDSIPLGFIAFDENDRLAVCNQRYRDLYPEVADALVEGARFEDVARQWSERSEDRPEDQTVEQFYRRRLAAYRKGNAEFEFTRRDGSCLLVSETKTDAGTAVSVHTDVSPLKRREMELKKLGDDLAKKNAHFDGALNTMTQGLVTFDPAGRLIFCNRRYQEIFGLPDELAVEGTPTEKIFDFVTETGLVDDIYGKSADARARAYADGFTTSNRRFTDGRTFEVHCIVLENGDLLVALHEVTAFEKHAEQLNEYAERLEFSNRELQEFAYVASHDLQEPLRKIEAFGGRLRKKFGDRLDEAGMTYLDRMEDASSRMRSLICELLNYSRITTKQKTFEATDLNVLVDGVLNDLEVGIESSGAEISYADLPTIEAEPTQLRQLFQNLISNAIKFRKPDTPPAIEISAGLEGVGDQARCVVSVADNGIGFDQKHADQIFKIFHRLHGRSEYEGTGIGLATCRKIVDIHAGSIEARGEPGVGTTVTFKLPVKHRKSEETRDD